MSSEKMTDVPLDDDVEGKDNSAVNKPKAPIDDADKDPDAQKPKEDAPKNLSKPSKDNQKVSFANSDTATAVVSSYGEVIKGMDEAYTSVCDDHNSDVNARKQFARQAAFATFFVNMTFLVCGALFFASQTDWEPVDIALFTVYTVTSAGYGHVPLPDSALFQIVDTFYILIGLSLMAIMMAQVYQFLELEASRLQQASDKAEVLQQGLDRLENEPPSAKRDEALAKLKEQQKEDLGIHGRCLLFMTRVVVFSVENPWGDFLHRIGSLAGLVLLGAIVVGSIEGWTWYTSVYWAVVSLTTVGYGDVVPQSVAGKAFTTVWLPLNLFFLSILFCSVGHYYLMFSDSQIKRIQRQLQEKRAEEIMKTLTRHSSSETSDPSRDVEMGATEGADASLSGSESDGQSAVQFRGSSIRTSLGSTRSIDLPMNRRYFGANMETMKDVLDVVHESSEKFDMKDVDVGELSDPSAIMLHGDAPNFHLRVKVKERVAYIIAEEIAGRQSSLTTEDKAGVLSVFLGGTVDAAEKWMIPRAARRAFRAVAFEALLFVGESTLVREGDAALHRLTPMEFHRIFSPLLVAMGDKGSLEGWLTSTEVLWEKENNNRCQRKMSVRSLHSGHKDYAKSGDKAEFPTNHAEGFHLFRDT